MPYERKTYDILVSDKLKSILKEFESESVVASLLLKKRHNKEDLVENPINFISISNEDTSKISYMTQERMSIVDESEYWVSSRRFKAKPGSFISKIFKDISGKEVEKFSNLYKSHVSKPKFTFKVVSGESIRKYYHYSSHDSDRGSLGSSCMRYNSCQSYFNIYVDNKDIISMLVMLNEDGGVMGRALLWNINSHKLMDRIYTISDEELSFYFKKWASKKGYLHKSDQNWFNTLFFEQVGKNKQELKVKLNLKNDYVYYPYMDTFKFIDFEGGLYNYVPQDVDFRILCSSDGSKRDSDYLRFDSIDKILRYKNDSVRIDYLSIWTGKVNANWSDINDQYILKDDCKYDDELGDYIFIEEHENLNNVERIEERKKQLSKKKSGRSISSYFDSMLGDMGVDPTSLQSSQIQEIIRNFSEDWPQSIDIETEV
jgi:hypothetical protein